jgi:60 kDa SS-A/Ro ribonucleoprotein
MSKNYISASVGGSEFEKDYTVPQSQPASAAQVANSAGGFSFQVDDFTRLNRFLFLGSEGGTYYIKEKDLTLENVKSIVRAIEADGVAVASRILEVSTKGLAHRQKPTLFAWALVAKYGDLKARQLVHAKTPEVARTGTMMFQLVQFMDQIAGWSAGRRRAIGRWYTSKTPQSLAYQIAKYPQRDGWSHLDVIRTAHPAVTDEGSKAVMDFLTGKIDAFALEDRIGMNAITGAARAAAAQTDVELLKAIRRYDLTWEMIPTESLNKPALWDELAKNSGYSALLRNLNRLTSIGWLAPGSDNLSWIKAQFTNQEFINSNRIHPFAIYLASRTYGNGRGMLGSKTWTPITGITDALDEAFTKAFHNVEPTGGSHLLALDCSGSMGSPAMPGVSALEASAALATILVRTEPNVQIIAFSDGSRNRSGWSMRRSQDLNLVVPVDLSARSTINSVHKVMRDLGQFMTGTDCALPFLWAQDKGYKFDSFSLYTDSETWAGTVHPHVALKNYRKATGVPARSLVVGMTSNGFSIADPADPGMLDAVGLDASLPVVARNFFLGEI